jgi:hypothetical protein
VNNKISKKENDIEKVYPTAALGLRSRKSDTRSSVYVDVRVDPTTALEERGSEKLESEEGKVYEAGSEEGVISAESERGGKVSESGELGKSASGSFI